MGGLILPLARKIFTAAAVLAAFCGISDAQEEKAIQPSGTYLYAQRDTCDLFMDVYNPAPGSITAIDGVQKHSIIFIFGG